MASRGCTSKVARSEVPVRKMSTHIAIGEGKLRVLAGVCAPPLVGALALGHSMNAATQMPGSGRVAVGSGFGLAVVDLVVGSLVLPADFGSVELDI
jgi:hypothetical protein